MNAASIFRPLFRFIGHQDYIKFSLRKRWISRFHDPEIARYEKFDVNFYENRYIGNFNSTLDWEVYYFGVYAKEEMHILRDILNCFKDPIMFDVGGNCGHHALYASRHAVKVHTFEPYPPLANKIREKISTNSIRNVAVHELALGEAADTLPYYPPDDNHIGLGSFLNKTTAKSVDLKVVKADELFSDLDPPYLNLVKLDVEGFEVSALKGMRVLLERCRPVVFLEWSEPSRATLEGDAFLNLFPDGYTCFNFIDNSWRPRLRVFRQPGYNLEQVSGEPPLSSLLVAPSEFVERGGTKGKLVALRS